MKKVGFGAQMTQIKRICADFVGKGKIFSTCAEIWHTGSLSLQRQTEIILRLE